MIEIIGLTGIPIVKEKDNLAKLIIEAAERQGTSIEENDIIVVTHVIVSRAEGRTVNLATINPSEFAKRVAEESRKNPALVEVILRESKAIIRRKDYRLITETITVSFAPIRELTSQTFPAKELWHSFQRIRTYQLGG